MRLIAPDYYPLFRCAADACRHTCCAGWEIGIDEETLELYRSLPQDWRKKLFDNMEETDGEFSFRLVEGERCPFLNRAGLCDLILAFGEHALCQICADHPRFRNFFSDRTEIGLGLCCEEAGRVILFRAEKMKLICLEDDGENETLTAEENKILALREKCICLAQDRSFLVEDRAVKIAEQWGGKLKNITKIEAGFLLSLERMEDEWRLRLEALSDGSIPNGPKTTPEIELAFEQFLVYLLYRHVSASNTVEEAKFQAEFALYLWALARKLCAAEERRNGLTEEKMIEIFRLISAELEYSDCNPDEIREHLLTEKA